MEGAVGNVVVQLAKHVLDARVIAIVGSNDMAEYVRGLGADVKSTLEKELIEGTPEYSETWDRDARARRCKC